MNATFEQILVEYDARIGSGKVLRSDQYYTERALYNMLRHFQEYIAPVFEESYDCFHKSFRQINVIPQKDGTGGNLDMVVWHLLQLTTLFWEVCKEHEDVL